MKSSPLAYSHAFTQRALPQACGSPSCRGRWLNRFKDKRRPFFEGSWLCSFPCLAELVELALRREERESAAEGFHLPHRHRIPLGLILLERGWISQIQLQRALAAQRTAGCGSLGDWLIASGEVEREYVLRALSIQWGCPLLSVDGFDASAMALIAPRVLLDTFHVLPLRIAGNRILYLAFVDEPDASTEFALRRMSGLKVEGGLIDRAEWDRVRLQRDGAMSVAATLESVSDRGSMVHTIASTLLALQPRASRLVRVHHFYWLRMWLETGAISDQGGGVPAAIEDVADRIYVMGPQQ